MATGRGIGENQGNKLFSLFLIASIYNYLKKIEGGHNG